MPGVRGETATAAAPSGAAAPTRPLPPATWLGLFAALVLPTVPSFFDTSLFGPVESVGRVIWGLVVHWANLAAVVAVVLLLERRRLSSIGLKPLRWHTIPLGLAAGLVILPISGVLTTLAHAKGDVQFAAFLQGLPFGLRLLVVVTAGVFEETLFRGYAVERLTAVFRNKWAAGAVTLVFFTLAHVPAVGLAYLLPVFIVSALVTLLYLWRRDLVVNIIAHATIDGVGLLVIPLLGHHA